MDCYTANWNPLGDSAFYRKYELYSMAWDLKEELRDCLVAAAPYGGPIGMPPLCHCMFWDHWVNSRFFIPVLAGVCW